MDFILAVVWDKLEFGFHSYQSNLKLEIFISFSKRTCNDVAFYLCFNSEIRDEDFGMGVGGEILREEPYTRDRER